MLRKFRNLELFKAVSMFTVGFGRCSSKWVNDAVLGASVVNNGYKHSKNAKLASSKQLQPLAQRAPKKKESTCENASPRAFRTVKISMETPYMESKFPMA